MKAHVWLLAKVCLLISDVYYVLGAHPQTRALLGRVQRNTCTALLTKGPGYHLGESLRGTSWKAPLGILSLPPAVLGCAFSMWPAGAAEAEACALKSALTAPLMLPVLAAAPTD